MSWSMKILLAFILLLIVMRVNIVWASKIYQVDLTFKVGEPIEPTPTVTKSWFYGLPEGLDQK